MTFSRSSVRGLMGCAALSALMLAPAFEAAAQGNTARRTPVVNSRAATAAPAPGRVVAFATQAPAASGVLILPLGAEGDLAARAPMLDAGAQQTVAQALAAARFDYKARKTQTIHGVGGWDRIVVAGLPVDATSGDIQATGAVVGRALVSAMGPVTLAAQGLSGAVASELATGMGVGHYRSDLYNTTAREAAGGLTVVSDTGDAASLYEGRGAALVQAMTFVRDLSNEPANVIYPETFVERTQAAFRGVPGVRIEVLDEADMARLGMGALLGVGQGSARPPRLLVVRYRGQGAPEGGPLALVGKGITFDTGGTSIKPSAGMGNMKMDMSGAASVVGATLALARSGAPVDVVAVAALAENMPGGAAIRPGDVLTAMNGKTIEIISTDAEGRLVLADALVWTETNVRPAAIVDLATLTGAVGGALGDDYAGLFSRHDALADQIDAAGRAAGERVWRLPLHPTYAADTASTIADIKNSGEGGAGAGTGAHFIGAFVQPDTPWAHLDIANMAYGAANDWKPAGSAGYGVRLLERFVRDWRPVAREAATGGS